MQEITVNFIITSVDTYPSSYVSVMIVSKNSQITSKSVTRTSDYTAFEFYCTASTACSIKIATYSLNSCDD